jgi:hypothetical protein
MISMAKAACNKTRTLFNSKLDLNVRKNLVMRYLWSTVFYGAETLTLWKVDHKYLKTSET